MEYTFIELVEAVNNKVFGFNAFNIIRNNLLALRERFALEHDSSGSHVPERMGWKGACAFARYTNGTGLLAGSLNVSSASHLVTGVYLFVLSGVSTTDKIGFASFYNSASPYYRAEYAQYSASTVMVRVYDNAHTLVDLSGSMGISFALYAG